MSKRITIKDRAKVLSKNARESMRYCALQYRKARADGSVYWMLRWLFNASQLRDCANGFLEAA